MSGLVKRLFDLLHENLIAHLQTRRLDFRPILRVDILLPVGRFLLNTETAQLLELFLALLVQDVLPYVFFEFIFTVLLNVELLNFRLNEIPLSTAK